MIDFYSQEALKELRRVLENFFPIMTPKEKEITDLVIGSMHWVYYNDPYTKIAVCYDTASCIQNECNDIEVIVAMLLFRNSRGKDILNDYSWKGYNFSNNVREYIILLSNKQNPLELPGIVATVKNWWKNPHPTTISEWRSTTDLNNLST